MNTCIDVGQQPPKEAVVQRLEHAKFDQVKAQVVTQIFLAHAVEVAVFSQDEAYDPTKVFDLGEELAFRRGDAKGFFPTEIFNLCFSATIVLSELFLGDGNFGHRVWNVVGCEELEDCKRRGSICVTSNELKNTYVRQRAL